MTSQCPGCKQFFSGLRAGARCGVCRNRVYYAIYDTGIPERNTPVSADKAKIEAVARKWRGPEQERAHLYPVLPLPEHYREWAEAVAI
jgi:hypothetical protein